MVLDSGKIVSPNAFFRLASVHHHVLDRLNTVPRKASCRREGDTSNPLLTKAVIGKHCMPWQKERPREVLEAILTQRSQAQVSAGFKGGTVSSPQLSGSPREVLCRKKEVAEVSVSLIYWDVFRESLYINGMLLDFAQI